MSAKAGISKLFEENGTRETRFVAGAIALILIAEYSIAETVTALAWKNPVYSYARNYISDLGVSGPGVVFEGRMINSPIYWVMNTAFAIEGILAVMAAILLRPLFSTKKWRITIPLLAIVHGIGIITVAIVHGSPEAFHERIGILHVIGAFLAIVAGNIECMCAGIAAKRSGAPGWFTTYSIFLGVLGLVGLIFLAVVKSIPPGITERISVDTIILWDITTGIFLLSYKKGPNIL